MPIVFALSCNLLGMVQSPRFMADADKFFVIFFQV